MNFILVFQLNFRTVDSEKSKVASDCSSYRIPFLQSLVLNSRHIEDFILTDLTSNQTKFRKITEGQKGLILLYDKINCNACVDSLIMSVNHLSINNNGKSSILAVAYSASIEYLRRFARINKIEFPLYLDSSEYLMKRLNIKVLPTVILFNASGEIVNSFAINTQNKDLNSLFFNSVTEYLNK